MFSSVHFLDPLGCWVCVWGGRGDTRDDRAEILFPSFLCEAVVSSSGVDKDVHSLTLSIQPFLCWPRCWPTLQGALRDVSGEDTMANNILIIRCLCVMQSCLTM